MSKLTEKVTIEREVTGIIADLVNFGRLICNFNLNNKNSYIEDSDLIKLARDFWDTQHGED